MDECSIMLHLSKITSLFELLNKDSQNYKIEFDFYNDNYSKEAILLEKPLKELNYKIYDFLKDFPSHSGLCKISMIINRLKKMLLSNSLFKFVINLELLLEQIDRWERYVPKQFSLKIELNEIFKIANKWRKMEINSWYRLLNVERKIVNRSTYHLWIHIYRLIQQDSNMRFNEIIQGLNEFIRCTSISEFPLRLSIIKAFRNQIDIELCLNVYYEQKLNRLKIRNYLTNLYQFYNQFCTYILKILIHFQSKQKV